MSVHVSGEVIAMAFAQDEARNSLTLGRETEADIHITGLTTEDMRELGARMGEIVSIQIFTKADRDE